MYSLVFYSHSDYSDAWKPMFGQTDKYYNSDYKKYLFVNEGSYDVPDGWECVFYDDSQPYNQRVSTCLAQLPPEDIIIFHHEDMFLFEEPKQEIISGFCEKVRSGKINFIKLCKASYSESYRFLEHSDNLYYSPPDLLFAIQPTICKVKDLTSVYLQTPAKNGWELELRASQTCMANSFVCCCSTLPSEKKLGLFHWESQIYPYFITAIVKGKWNLAEYPEKLIKVLKSYDVNPDSRGSNL